ncbi:MAG TPA: PDZ domain-containing protein, partial [Niabella sp.]|nr:PDZ domain-containing protein [Niabella sp.]
MLKILFIAIATLPLTLFAQEENQQKEAEQIVITQKGGNIEKMNIVVEGDKITINGKPVDKDSDANITVKRMKIKDIDNFRWTPGERIRSNGQFPMADREFRILHSPNKAMLGVVTEKVDAGAKIVSVNENTAAAKAGFKEGDIITAIDSKKIISPDELSEALKDKKPGDKVSVSYLRDGEKNTSTAILTKWEAPQMMIQERAFRMPEGMNFDQLFNDYQGNNNVRRFQFRTSPDNSGPKLGVQVQELESGNGVRIISVEPGSDAAKAGLKEGDIIKEANGKSVSSTLKIKDEIMNSKPGTDLHLKIDRNGSDRMIDIQLSRKLKSA